MSDFSTQLRLPTELKDRLDALLEAKYAPMKPPSRNSVFVLAIEEFVSRLEAENLSSDARDRVRKSRKSATS
ncbi:hypothetical protein [Deinococcus sp. S9]|uniref:hypothetical protein n=1 Tax=Deinococcus sp. S9 TaxID=2545754 RepID=UPI0010543BEF|nr:hypothetical protein [Deinococcus sp. S9]TDE87354.1 hypothetical protein E0686_02340 [Deinococcus sp. S9]